MWDFFRQSSIYFFLSCGVLCLVKCQLNVKKESSTSQLIAEMGESAPFEQLADLAQDLAQN